MSVSREHSKKPAIRPRKSMIPVPRKPNLTVQLYRSVGHTRHAAVRGNFHFTPAQWLNVNERIKKTIDIISLYDYIIQGSGPGLCELHTHLGVALVAEIIIRPIRKPCFLGEPSLKKAIRAMANNPKLPAFRHTYVGGKVWFFFRILDQILVAQPLLYYADDQRDTKPSIYCEERLAIRGLGISGHEVA